MTDDTEPVTPFPGPLPLVVALASVAGFLDAVSLARITHTFVAFQTGNLVLVGLDVGRGNWTDAAPPALAIVAYLAQRARADRGAGRGGRPPGDRGEVARYHHRCAARRGRARRDRVRRLPRRRARTR